MARTMAVVQKTTPVVRVRETVMAKGTMMDTANLACFVVWIIAMDQISNQTMIAVTNQVSSIQNIQFETTCPMTYFA